MAVKRRLTAKVTAFIDWEEEETLSELITTDKRDDDTQQEWTEGSGDGYLFNDVYYLEQTLPFNTDYTVNFKSLSRTMLNMTLTRSWRKLKVLCIENTSGSGALFIGTSGSSNDIGLFGYNHEIGPSGIYEMDSTIGVALDSTHRNVRVINKGPGPLTFRLLALGVKDA